MVTNSELALAAKTALGRDVFARIEDDGAWIIRDLDGGTISAADMELVVAETKKVRVPQVVSMRQARLALLEAGLLDDVNTKITGLSQADQIEWEYAAEVRRDHDLIANLGAALGLSSQEIDSLFIQASAIP